MVSLNPAQLSLGDLRRGDVLLLEPGSDPKRVSEMVTRLDGSPYSHAVVLDTLAPDFRTMSANYAHDGLVDGVDSVRLADFLGDEVGENRREARVLRTRQGADVAAAVADEARRYVEYAEPAAPHLYPYPGDASGFAWGHLLISAMAAACRHLPPGSPFRRFGTGVVTGLSQLLLPYDPCRVGPGGFRPPERLEWDCCYFVEHCFCMAGSPLGIVESDPDPREPLPMVLDFLGLLWEEIRDRFDGEDPAPDPEDDEPRDGDRREFMRLAGGVARTFDMDLAQVVAAARRADPGDLVWPPFVSPRLLIECPELDDLGSLPRGVFSER